MKKLVLIFLLSFSFISYSQEFSSDNASIVTKNFVNKGGKASEIKEYYLRVGKNSYFIKFCESNLSRKSAEKFMNKQFHVSYKVTEGSLDICDKDPAYAQSRVGKYVVIRKIFIK